MLAYLLNPEHGSTNVSFSIIQAVGFLLIFLSIKLPVKGWEEKVQGAEGANNYCLLFGVSFYLSSAWICR